MTDEKRIEQLKAQVTRLHEELDDAPDCSFCDREELRDEVGELREVIHGMHNKDDICLCVYCVGHRMDR